MPRTTGTYAITTTLGESVRAFVPRPLPPADPTLAPTCFVDLNRQAELALARGKGKPVKMTTMAGEEVTFARGGDGVTVTAADGSVAKVAGKEVAASNGVAIPIDGVLKKVPAPGA